MSEVIGIGPKDTVQAVAAIRRAGLRDTAQRLFEAYNTNTRRPTALDPRLRRSMFRALARALEGWFPADPAAAILDIGCGEGTLLCLLREMGYSNLDGFDLSPENVRICRQLELTFVRTFDALNLSQWPRRGYQAIFALDVIEHLPKPRAADFVEQARELLAPGGALIVQAPNMSNLWSGYHLHYDLTHEWGLTERTAIDLFQLGGFDLDQIEVRPCWSATTAAGRLRELYSRLVHRLLWLTEQGCGPKICTPNLLVRGVRR
ncbi:MAG: class I SAM-dependent methyltransferase [Bryobacteraceae bacterium]